MHGPRRRTLIAAAGAAASALLPGTARPQTSWPGRPIRIIVPFPPGIPLDVILRTVGPRLGTALGQPVVIENRPGAGGNIGFEAGARSPNDGYTLLGTASNFVANPSLFAKINYDPQKDFTPVIGLIRTPSVLVVAADSPIASLMDLIARAKAKPGGLAFASGGNGSLAHFAGELFKTGAGVDALHTPYKSAPDILNSLLSKQTEYAFPVFATALTHVKAGKFRALAVTSQKRMPQLPDAPTMLELLRPGGFDLESENGLVAPAGTPAEIVTRLNAEIGRILRDPAVADPMVAAGYEMA
ncbi:MAG: tripartite tricarboxylate transporter substrate binding protein, partial [Burkholderiales bacterium]